MLGINTPEQDVTAAAEKVRKDELDVIDHLKT